MQGRNNPDATRSYGPAYRVEMFIRARWVWFVMPVLLVVHSDCGHVEKLESSEGGYKKSILAVSFHGLPVDDTWRLESVDSAWTVSVARSQRSRQSCKSLLGETRLVT